MFGCGRLAFRCARLAVAVMRMFGRLGDGHDEPSVLNTLEPDEPAGELLDLACFAVHDEDLEA